MHGLILAGGEGSRLAADGVVAPKALIDVAGTPQLLRLAQQLVAVGCTKITCLLHEATVQWLSASRDRQMADVSREIERIAAVVPCRTPSSLHTFVAGLEQLPEGSVFATMVDSVMSPNDWVTMYERSSRALHEGAVATLAVTPASDDDDAPLWVRTDAAARVVAIGPDAAPARLVTGGVYAFSPRARALASAALASGGHRMRIFLGDLVASCADVRAVEVARIIDIDHRNDIERANAYMTGLGLARTVSERP